MDLDALLDRFRGPLIGYLAGQGNDPRTAIELAQDVFAEAYLSRAGFAGDWSDLGAVGAYLRGIASNLHRAERRRRRAIRRAGGSSTEAEPEAVPDARVVTPLRAAEAKETGATLRASLDQLPENWRTVLYMHYLEGSGLREIGALLGISERAVEGRLRRARTELRRALNPTQGARS